MPGLCNLLARAGPCLRPLSADAHRPSRGALHTQGKWFASPRWVGTLQRSCRWRERVRSGQGRSRSPLAAGIPTHVAGAAAGEALPWRWQKSCGGGGKGIGQLLPAAEGSLEGRLLSLPGLSFQRIANCWERIGFGLRVGDGGRIDEIHGCFSETWSSDVWLMKTPQDISSALAGSHH